ncbi:MAG: FAD synthetase family protein [Actinomycetota bacterium]|nr:FAD synthetase family protein [Actinomycetota bacterium]
MNLWRELSDVPRASAGRAVTIGAFDGVHLGHVAVLRLVHDLARARGLSATVLTFDRHPAEVVRPDSAPCLLTQLDQKLELLEATGLVDECVVLTFDETRSKEGAEEFVEEVLAGVLQARRVVVGADFHFGYRRHGDVPLLQRMGAELGFEVLGLGLIAAPEGVVPAGVSLPYSSTRVRNALAAGDVDEATAVLGRPHEVRGVLEGNHLVVPDRVCLPAAGEYDAECTAGGAARVVIATVNGDVRVDGDPSSGPAAVRFTDSRS